MALPARAAQLHFDAGLCFVLLNSEPLKVRQFVPAATNKRFFVVDLVARARAAALTVRRAWAETLEFSTENARAFFGGS